MADEILAFDRWVEEMGWAAKWEARGKAEAEAQAEKSSWEKDLGLMKQGYTVEQLEQMRPGDNEL
jgi:hypothetical protein